MFCGGRFLEENYPFSDRLYTVILIWIPTFPMQAALSLNQIL